MWRNASPYRGTLVFLAAIKPYDGCVVEIMTELAFRSIMSHRSCARTDNYASAEQRTRATGLPQAAPAGVARWGWRGSTLPAAALGLPLVVVPMVETGECNWVNVETWRDSGHVAAPIVMARAFAELRDRVLKWHASTVFSPAMPEKGQVRQRPPKTPGCLFAKLVPFSYY